MCISNRIHLRACTCQGEAMEALELKEIQELSNFTDICNTESSETDGDVAPVIIKDVLESTAQH